MKDNSFKVSLVFAFSQVVGRILFLIYIFVFSRYAKSEGIDIYTKIYIPFSLLSDLAILGIFPGTSKIASSLKDDLERRHFLKKGTILMILIGVFFFVLLEFNTEAFMALSLNQDPSLIYYGLKISAFSLLILPLLNFYRGYLQGSLKVYPQSISIIIEQGIRTILVLIIVLFIKPTTILFVDYVLVVSFSSCLISVLFLNIFLFKEYFKSSTKHNIVSELIKTCVPFGITTLFVTLYQTIDSVTLSKLLSLSESKIYYSTYLYETQRLIFVPVIFAQAIAATIMPRISKYTLTDYDKTIEYSKKVYTLSIVFLIPVFFLFTYFSEEIYSFFYENEVGPSVLFNVSIYIIVFGLYKILLGLAMGINKISYITVVTIISSIAKVFLNFIFIPRFGYIGAIYGTLIAMSISYLVILVVLGINKIKLLKLSIINFIKCNLACLMAITFVIGFRILFLIEPKSTRYIIYIVFLYSVIFLSIYYILIRLFKVINPKLCYNFKEE